WNSTEKGSARMPCAVLIPSLGRKTPDPDTWWFRFPVTPQSLSMPRRSPNADLRLIDDHETARQVVLGDRIEQRARAVSVFSIVVGQTRRRTTPAWEPTGYIRASAKSSSKVMTM